MFQDVLLYIWSSLSQNTSLIQYVYKQLYIVINPLVYFPKPLTKQPQNEKVMIIDINECKEKFTNDHNDPW